MGSREGSFARTRFRPRFTHLINHPKIPPFTIALVSLMDPSRRTMSDPAEDSREPSLGLPHPDAWSATPLERDRYIPHNTTMNEHPHAQQLGADGLHAPSSNRPLTASNHDPLENVDWEALAQATGLQPFRNVPLQPHGDGFNAELQSDSLFDSNLPEADDPSTWRNRKGKGKAIGNTAWIPKPLPTGQCDSAGQSCTSNRTETAVTPNMPGSNDDDEEPQHVRKIWRRIRQANGLPSTSTYAFGGGIRELVPPMTPSSLYYESYAEAQQNVGKPDWMPPANDLTIPGNNDEMKPWVIRLRNAMTDMSAYEDRSSSKLKKRWLAHDFVNGTLPQAGDTLDNPYYPQHWLEEKCWQTVVSVLYCQPYLVTNVRQEMCTRLHRYGPSIISSRDPLLLKRSFDSRELTFEQRMKAIIDIALHCKNRVGEMLNGGVIEEYLLAPGHLLD
jgi:hypothetical protein